MNRKLAVLFSFLVSLTLHPMAYAGDGDGATFAVVTSADSNTISSYRVCETGEWSKCDTLPIGGRPLGIATAEKLNSIYVSYNDSNSIGRIELDPASGKLTAKESVPSPVSPMGLCMDSEKSFLLCVGNESCELQSYRVEAPTGILQKTATVAAEGFPQTVAIHPNKKFVFVPGCTEDVIFVYHLDHETGALTSKFKIPAGGRPTALVVDQAGKYLIVANQDTHELWSYLINPENGELYPSATIETGRCPEELAISGHDNVYVDVVSKFSEELHTYSFFEETRGPKKVVTCAFNLTRDPMTGLELPSSVLITPDHRFLYVLQRSQELGEEQDKIMTYSVDPKTHALSPAHTFPIEGEGEKTLRFFQSH